MYDRVRRIHVDIEAWVLDKEADPAAYRQRQAVKIVLHAIAALMPQYEFHLKGGLLMALVYGSPRQTTDIDLSAGFAIRQGVGDEIRAALDRKLRTVTAELGYVNMKPRVSTLKWFPDPKRVKYPSFPGLKMKIAYSEHRLGVSRDSSFTIDISFNEKLGTPLVIDIGGRRSLLAYDLTDLVVEKYRAVLQQVIRRRERCQDVYDLCRLTIKIDDALKRQILDSLLKKCRSRIPMPNRYSMSDPEIKRRSGANWETLKLELEEVPDFETCFDKVKCFYERLPWELVKYSCRTGWNHHAHIEGNLIMCEIEKAISAWFDREACRAGQLRIGQARNKWVITVLDMLNYSREYRINIDFTKNAKENPDLFGGMTAHGCLLTRDSHAPWLVVVVDMAMKGRMEDEDEEDLTRWRDEYTKASEELRSAEYLAHTNGLTWQWLRKEAGSPLADLVPFLKHRVDESMKEEVVRWFAAIHRAAWHEGEITELARELASRTAAWKINTEQ